MATEYQFADSLDALSKALMEFNSKPEFYREVLGSGAKYFVHSKVGKKHIFGLSKFCAFQDISVEDYISTYRYKRDGGTTQKHIAWMTKQSWIPRARVDKDLSSAFDKWIKPFFPNYNLNNASFITIESGKRLQLRHNRLGSMEQLLENLELQQRVGNAGEEIALAFEIERIRQQQKYDRNYIIEHVAKKYPGAGYDIYSRNGTDIRYIEVKASLNNKEEFYITHHEIQTLTSLREEAFLYLVHITDLKRKMGKVYAVYQNPIIKITDNAISTPVLFKVKLNGMKNHTGF